MAISHQSYLRGKTSHRGSASVGGLQHSQQESPSAPPLVSEDRPARSTSKTPDMPSIPSTPSGSSMPSPIHARTNSLPTEPFQSVHQQATARQPTLQLDLNLGSTNHNPLDVPQPSGPERPDVGGTPASELSLECLEEDFNDILSGYGNAIQPLSPASDSPLDLPHSQASGFRTPPRASPTTGSPGPAASPVMIIPEIPSPSATKTKSSPGRFFHLRSQTDTQRPSFPHKRSGSSSFFSKSTGQSSSASRPSEPLSRTKSGREGSEAQLSPSKWRKEFMTSNMLRPAASSTSPPVRGQAL